LVFNTLFGRQRRTEMKKADVSSGSAGIKGHAHQVKLNDLWAIFLVLKAIAVFYFF